MYMGFFGLERNEIPIDSNKVMHLMNEKEDKERTPLQDKYDPCQICEKGAL